MANNPEFCPIIFFLFLIDTRFYTQSNFNNKHILKNPSTYFWKADFHWQIKLKFLASQKSMAVIGVFPMLVNGVDDI